MLTTKMQVAHTQSDDLKPCLQQARLSKLDSRRRAESQRFPGSKEADMDERTAQGSQDSSWQGVGGHAHAMRKIDESALRDIEVSVNTRGHPVAAVHCVMVCSASEMGSNGCLVMQFIREEQASPSSSLDQYGQSSHTFFFERPLPLAGTAVANSCTSARKALRSARLRSSEWQ